MRWVAARPEMMVTANVIIKTVLVVQLAQVGVGKCAILTNITPMAIDCRNILILPEKVAAKLMPRASAMWRSIVT